LAFKTGPFSLVATCNYANQIYRAICGRAQDRSLRRCFGAGRTTPLNPSHTLHWKRAAKVTGRVAESIEPCSNPVAGQSGSSKPVPTLSRRKRILFSLFTLVFLFIFAEVSLQLFYRISTGAWFWSWWSIPIYEEDPIRVYRLKTNLRLLA
jgi:hypothetical protein